MIGSTSDEALTRVERFLDEVDRRGAPKRADHSWLWHRSVARVGRGVPARASLVSSFGPAPDNQGGGGVTVVELKE